MHSPNKIKDACINSFQLRMSKTDFNFLTLLKYAIQSPSTVEMIKIFENILRNFLAEWIHDADLQ